jgi:prophage regulatory protein
MPASYVSSGAILQKIFLRKKELLQFVVPFSGSTLERKVRSGDFPAPIKISQSINAWRSTDVQHWLNLQARPSVDR